MADRFENYSNSLTSPATILLEVTPSDVADLSATSRAINVAAAGSVRVTTSGGSTATIYVAAGVGFPVRATRIWATGTTATGIVAMV